MRRLFRRIQYLFRRGRFAAELHEEMRLHLDLRAEKLARQGVADAPSAARRQFGNYAALQDASSAHWGWGAWERLLQDLRHAARTLRKTPGFTLMAVATLAIGLGINTAVYSVVNAVMVRALPYPEASRLVSLWEESSNVEKTGFSSRGTPVGGNGSPHRTTVSVANLADYRKVQAFGGVAAFSVASMNLTGRGVPERITGETVTTNFLTILGTMPAMGRNFAPEDESVVIVSHDTWQRRLAGDPAALQATLLLDGKAYRVIGVMPADFRSPTQLTTPGKLEFWIPAVYPPGLLESRGDHEVNALARLQGRAGLRAARAELEAVNANLSREYPATNRTIRAVIAPLRDDLTRNVSDSLAALFGASALIVLIACVNVANLFLVRAIGRRHEIGVRFAIGANRWRIARQFLAESLLVAAAGCLAGVALGFALQRALVLLAPANLPMFHAVPWDWRVFAAAAGAAALSGAVFGVVPAWQASQVRPADSLRSSSRTTAAGAQARWRATLTAAEIALSLILLVGAGLLLKSFVVLMGIDLGFQPDRVIAMNIPLPTPRYATPQQRLRFFERLEEQVLSLPGVQTAAYANRLPLRGGWSSGIVLDAAPDTSIVADCQAVSPAYFETLGIPLLAGRSLAPRDRDGQQLVAVVNQAFSRKLLNGAGPVGRRFHRGGGPWVEIVGMVNDIRRGGKTADITAQVYFPAAQTMLYPVPLSDFAVRSAGDPRALVNAIQTRVSAIDPDQPITNVLTLDEIVTASVAQRRFQTILLLVFAGVAVTLAIIGIYGVLSYSVTQRTAEFGIRVALGAGPGSILTLLLRQAGGVIAAGVAIGLAGAWALTVYIESLLFQVQRHDWRTYAFAVAALSAVSLAASLVPARRGSRVDPIVALRAD